MRLTRTTRRGFTLVELLVAAAMMILGMWLLSWVYQQGLESFRQARAQADLTAQQRMVTSILTRDLAAQHFLDDDTNPSNHGRRLSDQQLDKMSYYQDPADMTGKTYRITGYTPPKGGYFRAGSFPVDNVNNFFEGNDSIADSSRSTNHFLQFTSILPGGPSHQVFSAEVPAFSGSSGQYYSPAAEITYFLSRTGQTQGGVPLFDLYRQQRIVARNNDDAPAYLPAIQGATNPNDPVEVMVASGGQMRTLRDLTVPTGLPYTLNGQSLTGPRNPGPLNSTFTPQTVRFSEDKLMSNVLSFEVKFTGIAGAASGITWPTPFANGNSDYPYDVLPYDGKFDTFSSYVTVPGGWDNANNAALPAVNQNFNSAAMKPIRITGTMIRLRTYDTRTRSARQTTVTIDL